MTEHNSYQIFRRRWHIREQGRSSFQSPSPAICYHNVRSAHTTLHYLTDAIYHLMTQWLVSWLVAQEIGVRHSAPALQLPSKTRQFEQLTTVIAVT